MNARGQDGPMSLCARYKSKYVTHELVTNVVQWQALSCCEVQILLRSDFLEILDMFPHELDRCQRLANHLWPASPFEGPQVYEPHVLANAHVRRHKTSLVLCVC